MSFYSPVLWGSGTYIHAWKYSGPQHPADVNRLESLGIRESWFALTGKKVHSVSDIDSHRHRHFSFSVISGSKMGGLVPLLCSFYLNSVPLVAVGLPRICKCVWADMGASILPHVTHQHLYLTFTHLNPDQKLGKQWWTIAPYCPLVWYLTVVLCPLHFRTQLTAI